jgi:hypothetical protein
VDDRNVAGESLPVLRSLILGPQGSAVKMKCSRPSSSGGEQEFVVSLVRGTSEYFSEKDSSAPAPAPAPAQLPSSTSLSPVAPSTTHRKETYADGNIYEGEWKDDKRSGRGKLTYASGEVYEGEFKDGDFNGQGTKTYPDGRRESGTWRDDKFIGAPTVANAAADNTSTSKAKTAADSKSSKAAEESRPSVEVVRVNAHQHFAPFYQFVMLPFFVFLFMSQATDSSDVALVVTSAGTPCCWGYCPCCPKACSIM